MEYIATVACRGSSCQTLCLGETSFGHVTSELSSYSYSVFVIHAHPALFLYELAVCKYMKLLKFERLEV